MINKVYFGISLAKRATQKLSKWLEKPFPDEPKQLQRETQKPINMKRKPFRDEPPLKGTPKSFKND